MGLNDTPSAERPHIAFFGCRNAGKSSVVNAVTGQELSVVSGVKGTTTDPVRKAMELLPLGPVVIIDTPGFDDEGTLGEQRVRRARQILNSADMALLIVDACVGMKPCDEELAELFRKKEIPYLIVKNKCDLLPEFPAETEREIGVSARTGENIYALKEKIAKLMPADDGELHLAGDLVCPGETAVLVIPIDKAAPKGRLILPQQMMVRDLLDHGAAALCVRETELAQILDECPKKPSLVITDSQAFETVARIVPEDVRLTSFSILMARKKGLLASAVRGAAAIRNLSDGDRVLISEGCTHHRQCDDIGTVKLPRWLKKFTGRELIIETSSGRSFPENLKDYALIIHCGACMLNGRETRSRMRSAADQGVPMTNYGIAIAYMHGILRRSIACFPQLVQLL